MGLRELGQVMTGVQLTQGGRMSEGDRPLPIAITGMLFLAVEVVLMSRN